MPRVDRGPNVTVTWFIAETAEDVDAAMRHRVRTATRFLTDRVRRNISKPVGRDGNRVVRSRPGEFPRADTKALMQTTHSDFRFRKGVIDGFTITVQDYALELERDMDRSFMLRTFVEQVPLIWRILTRPIRCGGTGRIDRILVRG